MHSFGKGVIVENLVTESLKFMIFGMGIVFVLLIFIVFLTGLQSKVVAKFFPDSKEKELRPVKTTTVETVDSDSAVIAAISAAITHYKKG